MLTALRSLIWLASALVPRPLRAGWRGKWDRSLLDWWLLQERGELRRGDVIWMLRHFWTCFAEAFWLRFERDQLTRVARSPLFPLFAVAAMVALLAVTSGGFRAVRALFDPLPVKDSGALVSIRYTGAAGDPYGIPAYLVPLWREKSKHLLALAAYWHPKHAPNAWVTSDFFPLLGVTAAQGRIFAPGESAVALLSDSAWRNRFHADPNVIGGNVAVEGRRYRVIGVLPRSFWFISEKIEIWMPLSLGPVPTPGMPMLVGVVGRLKDQIDPWTLRQELFAIGREAHSALPRAPEVAWFQNMPNHGIPLYLCGMGFALTMATAMIIKGRPLLASRSWRYWAFFGAKVLSALLLPMLIWVELSEAFRLWLPIADYCVDLVLAILTLLVMLATAFLIWWSYSDQRRRCPVCVQRLALPVRIGSWSSVFEPVTTEFLCDRGHGALSDPEGVEGEAAKWTSLDSSWEGFFGGGGPDGRP